MGKKKGSKNGKKVANVNVKSSKSSSGGKGGYQKMDNDDYYTSNSHGKGQGKGKGTHKNQKKNGKEKYAHSKDDDTLRQIITGSNGKREIIEMQADGNCLFRSISHQLFRDYGQKHEQIREDICNYLEQNEEEFSIFLLLDEDEEDVREFQSYVDEMRQDGVWGGDVEIVCAARLYRRNVTIYSISGIYNIGYADGSGGGTSSCDVASGPDLLLSYHENSHYNSVMDEDYLNSFHKNQKIIKVNNAQPEKGDNETKRKVKAKGSRKQKGKVSLEDDVTVTDPSNTESSTSSSPSQAATAGGKERPLKRNDPCSCGSGLRYKKCCLAAEKNQIKLQKFREKHGIGTHTNPSTQNEEDRVDGEAKELETELRVLTI